MATPAISTLENDSSTSFSLMMKDLDLLFAQLQLIESVDDAIIHSLSACERQITHQSQQLRSSIDEYARMVASLYPPRPTSSTTREQIAVNKASVVTTPASPIARCPSEVLGYIFEYVVEGGSEQIRPLLTVNKRFHRLAMQNALLWRYISISFETDLTVSYSLSSAYIKTCLERSKGALLHIWVDCGGICGLHDFMMMCISQSMETMKGDRRDKKDIILTTMDVLERVDFDANLVLRLYNRRFRRVLDTLCSLAGPGNIHANRWGTFYVAFSDMAESNLEIWNWIPREMPSLETLRIDRLDVSKLQVAPITASWPSISHFAIGGDIMLWKTPLNFGRLKILEFCYRHSTGASNLLTLVECTSLQDLTINCHHSGQITNLEPLQLQISIPTLTSLTLDGRIDCLASVQFHLPRLEYWKLTCFYGLQLPEIHALDVSWHIRHPWPLEDCEIETEIGGLFQLLSFNKRMRSLTIRCLLYPKECLTEIQRMKSEKEIPADLRVTLIGYRGPSEPLVG
ncbi:hypothetical protein FRC17_008700 [Serendipita sp. 399]|nr:hypothetical protein FRC17_008700 [Serendipita sp. 399]